MNCRTRIPALLLLAAISLPVCATDGYYDATWIGGGRTTFPGDPANVGYASYTNGTIAQSNGNLLVGGLLLSSPYVSWWMGELLPDGTLNGTFGIPSGPPPQKFPGRVNGCLIGLSCADASYGFNAFARQVDGRVLVLSGQHLARTNATASALDAAGVTGGTGYVPPLFPLDTGTGVINPVTLTLQGDNKVLIAGYGRSSNLDNVQKFALARLNTDLSIDQTFTGNGSSWGTIVRVDPTDTAEYPSWMTRMADGRIVVAGSGTKDSTFLDIVRFKADGTTDGTFGSGGAVALSPPVSSGATGFSVDSGGRIVVAMARDDIGGLVVARVDASGNPDGTFGASGYFTLSAASAGCTQANVCGVALDSAGRIVAAGHCDNNFLVARIRGDNGALDTTFGIGGLGYGAFDPAETNSNACGVAFDSGGRLLITGSSTTGTFTNAGVSRLTYDLVYTSNFETVPRGCSPPACG